GRRQVGRLAGNDDAMIAGPHSIAAIQKKGEDVHEAVERSQWLRRAFVQPGVGIRQCGDFTCSQARDNCNWSALTFVGDLMQLAGELSSRRRGFALQAWIPAPIGFATHRVNELIQTANDPTDVVMGIPAVELVAVVGWGDAA
ncbi:unnamed protein product, partial [Prorocentrum cordatum]